MSWTQYHTDEAEALTKAAAAFRQVKESCEGFHLRNDLDWAMATHPAGSVSIYTDGKGDACRSYALLLEQDRPIPFQIGEIVWFRKTLKRYDLWEGPVFADASLSKDEKRDQTQDFLQAIHANLKAGEALSIEGLPTGSLLHDLLMRSREVKRKFVTISLGKPFAHQFIKMPATEEDYFGAMSGKTRRNLKYDQRKLSRDFDQVETICYQSPDSVDDFLDRAIPLSRKTYQWRLLGLGLRDRDKLREAFTYAAEHGWLRHYILSVDGQAVAFMLGYLYENCYYYTDVGFDPDWSKWSVGSVLQVQVIEDLYRQGVNPALFDFGTGFGYHKAQFGNMEREEVNILVLPKTLGNILISKLYRLNTWLEATSVFAVEKLGLKKALKQLIRNRSG